MPFFNKEVNKKDKFLLSSKGIGLLNFLTIKI